MEVVKDQQPSEGVRDPDDTGRMRSLVGLARLAGRCQELGGTEHRCEDLGLLVSTVVENLREVLDAPVAVVGTLDRSESVAVEAGASVRPAVVVSAGLPSGSVATFCADRRVEVRDPLLAGPLLSGPAAPILVDGRAVAFVAAADHALRRWSVADAEHVEMVAHTVTGAWSRQASALELERLKNHDQLTGLLNRRSILRQIDLMRAGGVAVAAVALGIDRFKTVNDSLGRSAGDDVLCQVANRLTQEVGPLGAVARIEGDRFVVILADVRGDREAGEIGEAVRRVISTSLEVEGRALPITVTAGVACEHPGETAAEVLRNAETAMYLAKERGRARTLHYSPRHRDRALMRLETELALRDAIDRGSLLLHYQPIHDLATGVIREREALVRWPQRGRGPVAPSEFIPLAEDTGLIVPLGAWVLEEACRQARAWTSEPTAATVKVAVNLSARQIAHRGLVEQVASVLSGTGLDPACLVLEITESVLMSDAESAMVVLRRLRDLGVGLSIDDFGTGYSSLSYLKRFPVDTLKIDRSFVSGLGTDPHDAAIVGATVRLAEALGLETIAEGVENGRQRDQLQQLGCTLGQGYYFARPAPVLDLTDTEVRPRSAPGLATIVEFPRSIPETITLP